MKKITSFVLAVLMFGSLLPQVTVRASQSQNFSVLDRGGAVFETAGALSSVGVGYGVVQPVGGSTAPAGVAIFGYRENGVLVSEAGVPASSLMQAGRTFAEWNGPVNTGIALANPNPVPADISFYFTDATGNSFLRSSFTLPAKQQLARFVHESPFSVGSSFTGTFTFESSVPVAVIALRGLANERAEFLISAQTVTPLSSSSTGPVYFPHFADGGGWATQVILVNTTAATIGGTAQFLAEDGGPVPNTPVALNVNGQSGSAFNYSIPPRSSFRLQTSNGGDNARAGSVRVVPAPNNAAPYGFAVMSLKKGNTTVSQAAVPAQTAGSAFRMYAEVAGAAGAAGSIRSGVAVSNVTAGNITVTFQLTTLNGTAGPTATATLPPSGHVSKFVDELFPNLSTSYRGVLRVSGTGSIAVVALRTRYNERGDFLITTTPPSDETAPASAADLVFPHIADGGGYSTQFILFSAAAQQVTSGTIAFYGQSGTPLTLNVLDQLAAFDDFERAELGGNWGVPNNRVVIVNNRALGLPEMGLGLVEWTRDTFAADQFSEIEISAGVVSSMLEEVFVRRRASDGARYGFGWNSGRRVGVPNSFFIKYDGVSGPLTRMMIEVPGPKPQPGDTLRIEIRGYTISGFVNGIRVISITDTESNRIDSGRPGVVFSLGADATATYPTPVVESWAGGKLR
jgi:hypothetical protein